MKPKHIITFSITLIIILISCNQIKIKTQIAENQIFNIDLLLRDTIERCWCKDYELREVQFQNDFDIVFEGKWDSDKNEKLFIFWAQDSLKHKVKSINFKNFYIIPSKYSIFENVEKLYIEQCFDYNKPVNGLECFKELKVIYLSEVSNLFIDTNIFNSKSFVAIFMNKSTITGIDNYKPYNNLKLIYLNESKLSIFFIDLTKLKKLQFLYSYRQGIQEFGMNSLDLKNAVFKRSFFKFFNFI